MAGNHLACEKRWDARASKANSVFVLCPPGNIKTRRQTRSDTPHWTWILTGVTSDESIRSLGNKRVGTSLERHDFGAEAKCENRQRSINFQWNPYPVTYIVVVIVRSSSVDDACVRSEPFGPALNGIRICALHEPNRG